ncbi:hypothetical protein HPB49_012617 [Dermacentor silvarum]|uniref:Uncharacterized protein n=1 Tax=Dermacentor silvarum TaxID=543639 RepID=A0ACB8CF51_DERSI|nr:hypothetical protein HPB49_012617 [Dermacentor silvarum]
MERSLLEATCAGGSRYFFSSWPDEDRLFLRQLYRRYASAGVHSMQENAASCDNRSQWPLWNFLAFKLQYSLDRSVSPKQIEQFFTEVDGGGEGLDKLDSLLFPRDSPMSTSDDGTAAEIRETNGGVPPNVGWEETEVDAPQSRECSEKQASDAGRVVGMTESPSAEVTLVSKDGRRASDGAVDAVPAPMNTDVLPAADPTDSVSVFPESDALDDLWALFGEDPVVDNESIGDDVARRRAPACDANDVAGVDSEAQFTANSGNKETQRKFDGDIMSELIRVEMELNMLFRKMQINFQLKLRNMHDLCGKSANKSTISRYFFLSWSDEERLFLHQLHRRYASAGVHSMQENAVSRGNRDNRSQWPLWHFLALELRSSLHRSVSPKQIEQFFREVDGGGWEETEVDVPHSQECSVKPASDAGRVVGMTENPSAEVTLVSKDGPRTSDGAVDAVPAPINPDVLPVADPMDSESDIPSQLSPEASSTFVGITKDSRKRKLKVCERNFLESDFVGYTDSMTGKVIELRRKLRRLKPAAIPSIFPNCPVYLSRQETSTRESPEENCSRLDTEALQEAIQLSVHSHEAEEKKNVIASFKDLLTVVSGLPVTDFWTKVAT